MPSGIFQGSIFLCNALFPSEPKHLTGDAGPPPPGISPFKINQKVFLCNALFPSEPKHLPGDAGPPSRHLPL